MNHPSDPRARSGSPSTDPRSTAEASPRQEDALVGVNGEVIDAVGHFFGNAFHRLYHMVDPARLAEPGVGGTLREEIARLERVLRLLTDYVSPMTLAPTAIPAGDLGDALAGRLRVGARAERGGESNVSAWVDVARIGRAFDLLAERVAEGRESAAVRVEAAPGGEGILLVVRFAGGARVSDSVEGELGWAVACKAVELQGGLLQEAAGGEGDLAWRITLPRWR